MILTLDHQRVFNEFREAVNYPKQLSFIYIRRLIVLRVHQKSLVLLLARLLSAEVKSSVTALNPAFQILNFNDSSPKLISMTVQFISIDKQPFQ